MLIAYFPDFPGPEVILRLHLATSKIILLNEGRYRIETPYHSLEQIFRQGGATKIHIAETVAGKTGLPTASKAVLAPS